MWTKNWLENLEKVLTMVLIFFFYSKHELNQSPVILF